MIQDTIRTSARSPGDLTLLRASLVALMALAVGGAGPPGPAAQAGGVCQVDFTGISDIVYNPQLGLSGPIIMGSHNFTPVTRTGGPNSTTFELLDADGFLTLVILLNEWRASGQLQRNATEGVVFQRADLALALDAADRGLRYHQVVLNRLEENRPDNYADARRLLLMKLEGLGILADGLRPRLSGAAAAIELNPGFLSGRIGRFLDGLAPGPEQSMMAQYLDRPTGNTPNVLCDGAAASTVVGQVLCGYRFADGVAREPAICPQGIRFTRLAALPRCRREGGQDVC
ncbi:hypothetical protein [Brevundimonas sp. UBA7664]|uniref:hypothetical protein n=1 Tax=Brevundimonas sp. UBA7664 TaxID=1946141 RepID=UPI0025BDBAC3|nr:hypothetical protein [Brevundimonas sp. UBA7664]